MGNSVSLKELMIQLYETLQDKYAEYPRYDFKYTSDFPVDLYYRVLRGNEGKKVVLLLGEKGAGKTALAIDIVRQLINSEEYSSTRINFLSLTHPPEEIALRWLSVESRVSVNKLFSGNLSSDDWRLIAGASGALAKASVKVTGAPLSLHEAADFCSGSCNQSKYDLTLIDSTGCPEDLDIQSTHTFLDKVITQLSGIQSKVVICLIDLPDKCLSRRFIEHLVDRHNAGIWLLCRDKESGRRTTSATLMVGGSSTSNYSVYKLQYNQSFEVFEWVSSMG